MAMEFLAMARKPFPIGLDFGIAIAPVPLAPLERTLLPDFGRLGLLPAPLLSTDARLRPPELSVSFIARLKGARIAAFLNTLALNDGRRDARSGSA